MERDSGTATDEVDALNWPRSPRWMGLRPVTMIAAPVLVCVSVTVGLNLTLSATMLRASGYGVFATILVVGVLVERSRARLAREVHRSGYELCPSCLYALDGLKDEGETNVCPECGYRYTRKAVRHAWRAWEAYRGEKPGPATRFRDWLGVNDEDADD